jgi:DNA-binding PadR family transcriptional regulator
MGARVLNDGNVSSMRSSIHWAVLGLLIERPAHGYDVFQRFDDAYAGAIELTTHSQMNGAVKALEQRGLIERLPAQVPSPDRLAQRRISYQATAKGLRAYERWLMTYSPRSADAPGVFARHLAGLPVRTALAVIERYEQACLSEISGTRLLRADGNASGGAQALAARLIAEEKHLALTAKVQWARYARSQLKTLASEQADGQESTAAIAPADQRATAWALGSIHARANEHGRRLGRLDAGALGRLDGRGSAS